jgi:hypothetical protein
MASQEGSIDAGSKVIHFSLDLDSDEKSGESKAQKSN